MGTDTISSTDPEFLNKPDEPYDFCDVENADRIVGSSLKNGI